MKLTLRVTLTAILLALTVVTVAALGYSSYRNARFTADDLTAQVLEQTTQRLDAQINDLLRTANVQGQLNERLLRSGQFNPRDFRSLAKYWVQVMSAHPRLTRISLGLEDTGEWVYVRRQLDGRLAVGELRRNADTGQLDLSDFLAEDYPLRTCYFGADKTDEDPRKRAWYVGARKAHRQVWSETYVFFGVRGVADVPGVSCATPLYDEKQNLRGVLTTSFDIYQLCNFLKGLAVGDTGYAFVMEFREDGTRRVIAHPDPSLLLRAVPGEDGVREWVPPEDLADRRVGAFLGKLPPEHAQAAPKEAHRLHFYLGGVHYLGSYQCLSSSETPDWLICVLVPEDDILGRVHHSNLATLWIGLCILVFATLVSLYVSRVVSQPLSRLARETEAIGRLQVDARPVAHSPVLEVDRLAVAVEETKTSLRSFQKYVPADLVRLLMSTGQEAVLGGESRTVTVYFCDLADFTSVSEALPPEQLVRHLGDYFGAFSADILATGGTVDKYIGDAIMAFWGAPKPVPGHALAACTAALRNQAALKRLRERWQAEGRPLLFARIGIHTGEVVVGNIGNPARLNYTVMGDTVNLASRLEGLNKYYGTEILLSEHAVKEAGEAIVARPVDWVAVKGRTAPVLTYELLALRTDATEAMRDLAGRSAEALAAYRAWAWPEAAQLFDRIAHDYPGDGPARVLAGRSRAYQAQPPAPDWAGVYHLETK
jgi:adenylate cyclase